MSKPVFSDLFSFSGRRNRQSYILLQLALLVGYVIAIFMIGGALASAQVGGGAIGIMLVGCVLAVTLSVISWASMSQRIRDFGQSGVWSLVILIPYVGFAASLALMFAPSDVGENRYGLGYI